MKFSHLSLADLTQQKNAEVRDAAIPAIPAIDVDSKGNSLAIPLLFSAIPLLFDASHPTPATQNSSRIAANSSRIANKELLIPDLNHKDTEKIAGIAKIAASKEDKTLQEAVTVADKALQAKALVVLQKLHAQHVANLEAGGQSGRGAMVRRDDYWKALRKARLNPDTAFDLLDAGRVRVQADGLYWIPEAAP